MKLPRFLISLTSLFDKLFKETACKATISHFKPQHRNISKHMTVSNINVFSNHFFFLWASRWPLEEISGHGLRGEWAGVARAVPIPAFHPPPIRPAPPRPGSASHHGTAPAGCTVAKVEPSRETSTIWGLMAPCGTQPSSSSRRLISYIYLYCCFDCSLCRPAPPSPGGPWTGRGL